MKLMKSGIFREMPAASVRKNEGLIKTKKKAVKPSLCTPFKTYWAPIEKKHEDEILHSLESMLSSVNLKPPVVDRRAKKEEREKQRQAQLEQKTAQEKNLSSQLVIGANSLTRAVEKDRIRLCVVDRASPWQLHKHLIQLCALRDCPAVAVKDLSGKVSPCLGVTTCAALGFTKLSEEDDPTFNESLEKIVTLIPASDPLPWIHTQMELADKEADEESPEEEEEEEGSSASESDSEDKETILEQSGKLTEAEPEETLKFNSQSFISFASSAKPARTVELICGISDLLESEAKYHSIPNAVSHKRKAKKGKGGPIKKGKFHTANVGQMVARPDKKKKK